MRDSRFCNRTTRTILNRHVGSLNHYDMCSYCHDKERAIFEKIQFMELVGRNWIDKNWVTSRQVIVLTTKARIEVHMGQASSFANSSAEAFTNASSQLFCQRLYLHRACLGMMLVRAYIVNAGDGSANTSSKRAKVVSLRGLVLHAYVGASITLSQLLGWSAM